MHENYHWFGFVEVVIVAGVAGGYCCIQLHSLVVDVVADGSVLAVGDDAVAVVVAVVVVDDVAVAVVVAVFVVVVVVDGYDDAVTVDVEFVAAVGILLFVATRLLSMISISARRRPPQKKPP